MKIGLCVVFPSYIVVGVLLFSLISLHGSHCFYMDSNCFSCCAWYYLYALLYILRCIYLLCVAHCPWASVSSASSVLTVFRTARHSLRLKNKNENDFSACVKLTKREHNHRRVQNIRNIEAKQNKYRIHVYSVLSCYLMTTTHGNETFILSYSLVYWTKRCSFSSSSSSFVLSLRFIYALAHI